MADKTPKTSRYVEVERKFDVDESTLSPSFAGLAAIGRIEKQPPQTLHAIYFDTPARDLAAKKVTLRRRSGGPDEGWHLKLPAGPDARTEIRAPLGTADADHDCVPDELRDVVLAIVRDRPLQPVAQINTTRDVHLLCDHDGAVLAEFCDDEVAARSAEPDDEMQRWREWEIELVGSDTTANPELLDRLSNRLLDAGATPARHGSKLARVLGDAAPAPDPPARTADPLHAAVAEQVDELLVWDRAVRADADDAVHQMRVTSRKIRSLLRVSPQAFGLRDNWVPDELGELADVLGIARDAEVLAERYQQALDRLPPELVRGPIRQRLVEGARRRYRTGLQRSLTAMRSQRYFRLLDALDAVLTASPPSERGPESTPVNIDAAYKRVWKAAKTAAKAPEEDRDKALHRTRISAKRLRYTAAATGATKVAEQAKTIQTLLGDHQDSVVSREHLSRQAAAAHAAGEDTFSYGLLYQQEAELARSCRQQLDAAMRKLDKAARKARH